MQKGIIGKKIGMTQIFDEHGKVVPVTVIEAGPCVISQKKTVENDGYAAVQMGYGDMKAHKVNKPMQGHFAKGDVAPKKVLREFRLENTDAYNVGDLVKVDVFAAGDKVDVCGAIGVARTIFYQGHMGEPLYTRRADGCVSDGVGDETASFLQEYSYKLEGICDRLLTRRGAQIARERNAAARAFYAAMLDEVRSSCDAGERLVGKYIQ